jgi:hypothetical protein
MNVLRAFLRNEANRFTNFIQQMELNSIKFNTGFPLHDILESSESLLGYFRF